MQYPLESLSQRLGQPGDRSCPKHSSILSVNDAKYFGQLDVCLLLRMSAIQRDIIASSEKPRVNSQLQNCWQATQYQVYHTQETAYMDIDARYKCNEVLQASKRGFRTDNRNTSNNSGSCLVCLLVGATPSVKINARQRCSGSARPGSQGVDLR